MRENKYDNETFFEKYSAMPRSLDGLAAAGEWHAFQKLFPDLDGRRVLDLGCGFGWHCRYAAALGAREVLGVDLSAKMLAEAGRLTNDPRIRYERHAIEDFPFRPASFDVVVSSLALHYVASFAATAAAVARCLTPGGDFVFSVEHPIFTAQGPQEWHHDAAGNRLHWPVDHYFAEGPREAVFLGETVAKSHKTLTTYLAGLLAAGFRLTALVEPQPDPGLVAKTPELHDELRRPMMLLVAARLDETPRRGDSISSEQTKFCDTVDKLKPSRGASD